MKVTSMLLAEHVTVSDSGLVNILSGGITSMGRPIFPAPMNVLLVVIVSLDGYESGSVVTVETTVTSEDGTEVFARAAGQFSTEINPEVDPRCAASPIVLDLRQVALTKAGPYMVNVQFEGEEPESLRFQVLKSQIEVVKPDGSTEVVSE